MLLTASAPVEIPDPKLAWSAAQWAHDRPLVSCRFDPTGQYVFCGSEDPHEIGMLRRFSRRIRRRSGGRAVR